MHVCSYVRMFVGTKEMHVRMYVCVCVCMYVRMYVCILECMNVCATLQKSGHLQPFNFADNCIPDHLTDRYMHAPEVAKDGYSF